MLPETDLTDSASLPEGALKVFPTPPNGPQVLLTRQQGQVHAFAPNCPHYGAPLEKGKVVAGKLICPWHHACFRLDSGHLCEPPALDDLPKYTVREADSRILVQLPPHLAASTDQPDTTPTAELGGTPPPAAEAAPADGRTFVIVGGGAAGEYAAQTLRREGFAGRIVLMSAEKELPYDRTKLSKAYLAGKAKPEALPLREPAFYEQQKIERLTARAAGLDLNKQEVSLEGQPALRYDQLLLAPGGTPNLLPKLPGHDLPGVLPLRSPADADALLAATKDAKQVVIIGSSFIGMEAASSLVGEGRAVTVVAQEKVPFERVLGLEIGAMFRQLHEEKGVKFEVEAEVTELLGTGGHVSGVRLKAGPVLPADAVVLGVGVRPATDWLKGALQLEKDGGLTADACLRVAENVYAAGDIVHFPLAATGQPARIEHWRLAQQHGRVAARNMLGRQEPFTAAPFFWAQQYGKSLRYAGHAEKWDEIRYLGDVAKQDFLALYVQAGRIVAAAGMGRDADMIYVAELLNASQLPPASEVSEATKWAELAAKLPA